MRRGDDRRRGRRIREEMMHSRGGNTNSWQLIGGTAERSAGKRLEEYLERGQALRDEVRAALTYPVFLVGVMSMVMVIFFGFSTLGGLVAGVIGDRFTVPSALATGGVVTAAVAVVLARSRTFT